MHKYYCVAQQHIYHGASIVRWHTSRGCVGQTVDVSQWAAAATATAPVEMFCAAFKAAHFFLISLFEKKKTVPISWHKVSVCSVIGADARYEHMNGCPSYRMMSLDYCALVNVLSLLSIRPGYLWFLVATTVAASICKYHLGWRMFFLWSQWTLASFIRCFEIVAAAICIYHHGDFKTSCCFDWWCPDCKIGMVMCRLWKWTNWWYPDY